MPGIEKGFLTVIHYRLMPLSPKTGTVSTCQNSSDVVISKTDAPTSPPGIRLLAGLTLRFSPPGVLYLLLLKTTKRIVLVDFAHLEFYLSGQAVLFS